MIGHCDVVLSQGWPPPEGLPGCEDRPKDRHDLNTSQFRSDSAQNAEQNAAESRFWLADQGDLSGEMAFVMALKSE